MNLPRLAKGCFQSIRMALRSEREKSCEPDSVESTDLSQRLIHDDVRTEASKEAVWPFAISLARSQLLRYNYVHEFRWLLILMQNLVGISFPVNSSAQTIVYL
jgi:hypothetical protein